MTAVEPHVPEPGTQFTPGMCPNCAVMVAQLQKLSRLLEEIAYLASTHHVRAAEQG